MEESKTFTLEMIIFYPYDFTNIKIEKNTLQEIIEHLISLKIQNELVDSIKYLAYDNYIQGTIFELNTTEYFVKITRNFDS